MANVIFKSGLRANYDAITRDALTFYRVQETNGDINLYLGDLKISNDADLQAALIRIGVNETDISNNEEAITKLRNDLDALTGDSSGSISDQLENLENTLNAAIAEVQGNVTKNTTAIGNEVTRAQTAESALDKKITDLETLVNNNETDIEIKVSKNTSDIATHAGKLDTQENLIAALQGADEILQGAINTEKGRVDILVGNDSGKSVREVAAEETAKIVAGADANYDTLKEIADWITNDTTGAADMANDIKDLQKAIEDHDGLLEDIDIRIDPIEDEINRAETGIKARLTAAEGDIDKNAEDILKNAQAITAINDGTNGILAQSKAYAKGQVDALKEEHDQDMEAVGSRLDGVDDAIQGLETAVNDINDGTNGILAQARNLVTGLENRLGTAAFAAVGDFDAAGSAAAAETAANSYTDGKFDAAKAYTDSCLTWQSI